MSNELETQIEDDLLKDKVNNFFKKNKIIFFLLIFIFIIVPISIQVFFYYKSQNDEKFISKYIEAEILINKDNVKGLQMLNMIKLKGNDTARLLAVSKIAEYYLNNNQKDKALIVIKSAKKHNNGMLSELSEIKSMILNFDNLEENEILQFTKKNKSKANFNLIKNKLLYDYYIKTNQMKKANQIQINSK